MDCDCDSPNVMSFGHQFLRIFSLPFTGLKLFICPWLFHLRCSNTDLYIGTWWIFRQYFPHAILKWNWMCHRFVTMDPIRHGREKGIFISEKKKKRKGIHLLPHMIISVRDQRGQFNERRAHKHTHVRKNQNRMGNHWGDAQGNSRLVGVTSDGTLYNSISRGNQNKNREQQQNKKKDAQKERVWHAWPHIHKTDPSKNGDQNIRAILAPRDKTEEESNRRIDEKWKEKRNQRRRKEKNGYVKRRLTETTFPRGIFWPPSWPHQHYYWILVQQPMREQFDPPNETTPYDPLGRCPDYVGS